MGLTSHKVLALSALVSVLLIVGTVWLWPRLANRSWVAVCGRLGTILGTQLAVMVTLGLLANNYFAFYSSWADLLGTNNDGPVTIQNQMLGGGKHPGVQQISNENVRGTNTVGREPAVVGKLERIRIPGASTGLATEGYVYLPPQYFQPDYQNKKFPAVIAITGFPGDAKNLITKLNYPSSELQLIKEGKSKPTVLVMMRPSPAMPRDTECEDIPGGPQSETYFAKDVPQAIRGSYRIADGAGSWGVIGNSTGGYCALKLAMKHPDVFSAAVSLSGYYRAAEDPTTGDLFGGSQQRRDAADLDWRLANLPKPQVSLLVGGSKEGDGDYYSATRKFIDGAKGGATKVSSITLETGGHNFNTWSRMLPASLGWLGEHLNAPA
ncbi:alpha/beta hydrolase-fold protein [Kitasatospora atroaurantiaca]|uniref:S-formylglutathione hydrolase FrmB n=1 Tax=Kitasatospora atroaurantiaca TaxID=285545 RepID=A0A561ETR8_9ACTN|nr:alpha/beta hydrolase-fold protein [Kitasatospora atroaurantiaca]TWE19010.1 S-formylglutathione hydrolase FrmB [Kitasatospora atroaurantiaca]